MDTNPLKKIKAQIFCVDNKNNKILLKRNSICAVFCYFISIDPERNRFNYILTELNYKDRGRYLNKYKELRMPIGCFICH